MVKSAFAFFRSQADRVVRKAVAPSARLANRHLDDLTLLKQGFDEEFYLESHDITLEDGETAAQHFLTKGWRLGFDPSREFSTSWYLKVNTDVRDTGGNPFLHYLRYGRSEGRQPSPDQTLPPQPMQLARDMADLAGSFDEVFYRATNPDLDFSDETELEHFARIGWRERRNPTSDFSIDYYLSTNPDVAKHDLNPFWHYIVAGRDEGRAPHHPAGHKHDILSNLKSLPDERAAWVRHHSAKAVDTAEPENLGEKLGKCLAASGRLIISIGHDDFQTNVGGVQLCIQHERDLLAESSVTHLNLHPRFPLPTLAPVPEDSSMPLIATLDGELLGEIEASELSALLSSLTADVDCAMVVHSLMGHAPETLRDVSKAAGCSATYLWLHDYFSLCPSYALQRNKVAFCNAPDPDSVACSICVYGEEREAHLDRITALAEDLSPTILAPSDAAASYWSKKTSLTRSDVIVIPHMILSRETVDSPKPQPVSETAPIRIGFAGSPVAHKGWNTFVSLSTALAADPNVTFHYLGTKDPGLSYVSFHPVTVSKSDTDAMINAIRAAEIDLVLKWASWPETFCLAAYESILGGARILTCQGSGNVADLVQEEDCGLVLDDQAALEALLGSVALIDEAEKARDARAKTRFTYRFSDMGTDTMTAGPSA